MQKLLIVEPSEVITQQLRLHLQERFEITCCSGGPQALAYLNSQTADIMILNFMLPMMDGLSVLQGAVNKPPIILATTTLCTPYVARRAADLGVTQILVMPTPQTICATVQDILETMAQPHSSLSLKARVALLLNTLQIPTQTTSFHPLCQAILTYHQDPNQLLQAQVLAHAVKTCHCQSVSALDRGIRRAIGIAWKNRDPVVWAKFFRCEKKPPTVREFIARLALELDEIHNPL